MDHRGGRLPLRRVCHGSRRVNDSPSILSELQFLPPTALRRYDGYMAIEGSLAGDQWVADQRSLEYAKG